MTDTQEWVLSLLSSDAFVSVNKKVLRAFKGDATLVVGISELLSMYRYNLHQGSVDPVTTAFPVPSRYLEKSLGFSEEKQRRVLKELKKEGLISYFLLGRPRCRHVVINFEKIATILQAKESHASNAEFYRKLTEAGSRDDIGPALEKVLDNTKDPLRSSIKLISWLACSYNIAVSWTPKSVGQLKTILSTYTSYPYKDFDYSRVRVLADICRDGVSSSDEWIGEMIKKHKRVGELPPSERVYDWHQIEL